MWFTNSDRPQQLWGLMDCNNFYASCEKLFRPDLADKPVVVLSNNDGCIVARSAEAKALGVPMGQPEFKARAFLQQHHVAVFSSNYALYGDISNRVMETAASVISHLDVYSIDEAFLRFDGPMLPNAEDASWALRERVRQWTGITVSMGLAPTRTLAKIANHIAKKNDGVFLFPRVGVEQDALLAQTPVADVWGIGRRMAGILYGYGITSAKALRELDDVWLRKKLTITGWQTAMELRGIPCIDEGNAPTPRRTLVSSRSFGVRITEKRDLAEALTTFTARAAERLRKAGLVAEGIIVHIRSSRHQASCYSESVHIPLPESTQDTLDLTKAAMRGLDAVYKENVAYAKAGIMLVDLQDQNHRQGNLLNLSTPQHEAQQLRSTQLMSALDAINKKFGKDAVHFAGQGLDPLAPWKMRQNHRSPRYTSKWAELPVVKC